MRMRTVATRPGRWYKHDSPFTYSVPSNCIWAEISWSVRGRERPPRALGDAELLPLERDGEFAKGLQRAGKPRCNFSARLRVAESSMRHSRRSWTLCVVPRAIDEQISAKSRRIFGLQRGRDCIWRWRSCGEVSVQPEAGKWTGDGDMLRSVLMKPEHSGVVGRIVTVEECAAG